jgi:pyruvate formate-lyase/glycerol dehydratase family glycyl radical enzyme
MAQAGGELSERAGRLRERLEARRRERPWFLRRPVLVAEALRRTEGLPVHRRRAEVFAHLLRTIPVLVDPAELIVGDHPTDRPEDVDEAAIAEARTYVDTLSIRPVFARDHVTDAERLAVEEGLLWNVGWRDGHVILDYPLLLRVGFDGLRMRVASARNDADWEGGEFLGSVRLCLDAATEFIRRYAAACRSAGMTSQADDCDHVATAPPHTFRQALQLYWFAHMLGDLEEGAWGASFGRFDQYLIDYYRRDLRQGRLTEPEALELIECFWIKVNEYQIAGDSQFILSENLTLGGTHADGTDATNELTHLALEATGALRLHLPNVSVRVHAGTPDDLWGRIGRLVQAGAGQPQICNEDVMVPALMERLGLPEADARGFAVQGCIETHLPGQCAPWSDCGINLAGALLLALNGGRSLRTGRLVGAATPALGERAAFAQVLDAFEAQVRHLAGMVSSIRRRADALKPTLEAAPFSSALIAECIDRGRDVYDGGARHLWSGVYCVGPATTADSLLVLKRVPEGAAPGGAGLTALVEALRRDFEGAQELAAWACGLPRYGNDVDEPDALAAHVCRVACDAVLEAREPDGGRLLPVLSSHTINVPFGQGTPATPDGRRAGTPLSNVVSPSHGCDRTGPMALIRSAAKIDFSRAIGGSVLNLKLSPPMFRGDKGRRRLLSLLRTWMALGGHQAQVNFVDQAELLDAQEHPERHEDLIVRVSGFCSPFVRLARNVQDEIIARTSQK